MAKLNLNTMFVSVFGIGFIPFASGTFGSLAGLIIGYVLNLINYNLLFIIIPMLFILGVIASNTYQKQTGEKDSSVIVIDEVVGQLIAMMFVMDDFVLVFISFIIFRLFDIYKPWPASYADKKMTGGFGVMLDDVFAGIYTAIFIFLISYLL
ncbi:MAG: phosphatidylglycerophosphatase A [Pelagibacterales bacterium]|jgi:phosphatidylglycerophosphatase A|nr:phosphatidylglycerophosphatase A [Pelagibacterales bacterium]